MRSPEVAAVDAFDLPEWLGVDHVIWSAATSIGASHLVDGLLRTDAEELACDVLAGDLAFPAPVLTEGWRHDAHQAWAHGQVLLVSRDERLTLVVPGSSVGVERALEAVRRLAKAVGAPAERFSVSLRL